MLYKLYSYTMLKKRELLIAQGGGTTKEAGGGDKGEKRLKNTPPFIFKYYY